MVLDAVSDGLERTRGEGRRADVYGDGKHYKLAYYGDPRYVRVISKTGSDRRDLWNQIFLFLVSVLACSFVTGIISIPQRRIGQRTGFKNLFGMQKIKERRKSIGN